MGMGHLWSLGPFIAAAHRKEAPVVLQNIIAAVIAFLAAVTGFLAAVIGFLVAVIGFLAAVFGAWALGPGPRALGPVGPLIAAARWKEAPVEYNCCCSWIFSCCNWIFCGQFILGNDARP